VLALFRSVARKSKWSSAIRRASTDALPETALSTAVINELIFARSGEAVWLVLTFRSSSLASPSCRIAVSSWVSRAEPEVSPLWM
jgi:hypothetical protein